MIDWEAIKPWDYIVTNVAAEYHKKFPIVDLEDISQSLYVWFAEHPRKLKEWESLGKRDAKNLLYRSLRNQALDYCQQWKAKTLGYEVADLHYYEAGVVETLLPSVFLGISADMPKLNIGIPGKQPAPSEGGNIMVMVIEIDSAYQKLNPEDKRVLFHKYAESMDYETIATEMELGSADAARMRHNRAIKKLINRIGGYRPFLDRDSSDEKDQVVDTDNTESDYEGQEDSE
jgi:RNA polymerase sigma factor (sigma-70 family)